MEFTSFDDLKNLLGSDGTGNKPILMQRNIIGSSIKVKKVKFNTRQSMTGKNAMVVINKDNENLHYQQIKTQTRGAGGANTLQTGSSVLGQVYNTELNTYMKN